MHIYVVDSVIGYNSNISNFSNLFTGKRASILKAKSLLKFLCFTILLKTYVILKFVDKTNLKACIPVSTTRRTARVSLHVKYPNLQQFMVNVKVLWTLQSDTENKIWTRTHPSRMRTARLLTVPRSIPCIGGGLPNPRPLEADPSQDADPPPQIQIPPESDPLDAGPLVMWPVMHDGKPTPHPSHPHGQENTCENIT